MRSLRTLAALALATAAATTTLAAGTAHATTGFATSTAVTPASASRQAPADFIAQMYADTNAQRVANGVAPLAIDPTLQGLAQGWSNQQASVDTMYHNYDIPNELPSNWAEFGENVLQNWSNASASDLITQWMNSPEHHENLLNPAHTSMGIGFTIAPDGKLYATQEFAAFR